MSYQWDPRKARSNQLKHGIRFADAVSVFEDDFAVTVEDDDAHEERFVTIGSDAFGRILVVVYTFRGDETRLISAREATPHERDQYEGAS
ncbi:MAG TPA: BrnT family toxin [Chloroflexota bacterium]|nr:BrnT family toxin [Chloroflexota bacterium]HUM71469.1 BrnT family toxin [Chloroflexota bacterium]